MLKLCPQLLQRRALLPDQAIQSPLTIVGHAQCQALLETTVLALVPTLLLDFAVALAAVIFQLHTNGPPEEALQDGE